MFFVTFSITTYGYIGGRFKLSIRKDINEIVQKGK